MSTPYVPEYWGRDESQLWESISSGHDNDRFHPMASDQHAIDLFNAGWIEEGFSAEDRAAIRDSFFDYAIEEGFFYDEAEFDWVAWRDYMGY